MNVLEFDNLYKAWIGINKFLYLNEHHLTDKSLGLGGIYGTQMMGYNNHIKVKLAKTCKPDFDLALKLGYDIKKWSSLVNNYVDLEYLDLVKSEIQTRISKKANNYNYSYHFKNKHGSGKDCLISLIFSKRVYKDDPVVAFTVRTSEVTRRLIWDFVLVERIIEYVYGEDHNCELRFIAPSMFIAAESFIMLNNIFSIKKLYKKIEDPGIFQKRCVRRLEQFLTKDVTKMDWKVHQRAAKQLQKGPDGLPLTGKQGLYIKDLKLVEQPIHDIDIITHRQLNKSKNETNQPSDTGDGTKASKRKHRGRKQKMARKKKRSKSN